MSESIKMSEAEELARRYKEQYGDAPCPHTRIVKERSDLGSATGDYVCTFCGQAGWGKHWNEK